VSGDTGNLIAREDGTRTDGSFIGGLQYEFKGGQRIMENRGFSGDEIPKRSGGGSHGGNQTLESSGREPLQGGWETSPGKGSERFLPKILRTQEK